MWFIYTRIFTWVAWIHCSEEEVVSWFYIVYRRLVSCISHCSLCCFSWDDNISLMGIKSFLLLIFFLNSATNLCDDRPAALSQRLPNTWRSHCVECDGFTKEYPRNPNSVTYLLSLIAPSAADYLSHAPGELIYEVSSQYLVFHQILSPVPSFLWPLRSVNLCN